VIITIGDEEYVCVYIYIYHLDPTDRANQSS
jgi:hypothetical protein